jgi:hypothetical protein
MTMIRQTVQTVGEMRAALAHLPDDCLIHTEDGYGLELMYDNESSVLFDVGDLLDLFNN